MSQLELGAKETRRAWVEEAELSDLPALVSRLLPGFESLPLVRRDRFGDTLVVSLGQERVLRVACSPHRARQIEDERRLLETLQDKLTPAVPCPDSKGNQPAFYSYPWVGGQVWYPRELERASTQERAHFADNVAQLLVEMHGLELDRLAVPRRDWAKEMVGFILRSAPTIKIRDPSGRAASLLVRVVADFHAWQPSGEKVLLHNDFHNGNILWAHNHTRLCGLIDFAETWHGDPHWDMRMLRLLDAGLHEDVIRRYEARSGRMIDRERVKALERFQLILEVAGFVDNEGGLEPALARLFAHADGDRRFV